MRASRFAAAALLGAASVMGTTAASALARSAGESSEPGATVTPSVSAPGATVTLSVICHKSDADSIKAKSQAFENGSVPLKLLAGGDNADSTYTGEATLAPRADSSDDSGPNEAVRDSKWGIDGKCPDGKQWSNTVTIERGGPRGSVPAGVGGGARSGSTLERAAGGALAAVAAGGGWILRRRRTRDGS